ncbi:MAG: hypothetical protein M3417_09585 [Actinomycetota bacterium]|nr:hypothetical protein [Actinomycetota bacterium]
MPDLSRFSLPVRLLALVVLLVLLYLLFELITSFLFGLFYFALILAVVGGAALAYVASKQP